MLLTLKFLEARFKNDLSKVGCFMKMAKKIQRPIFMKLINLIDLDKLNSISKIQNGIFQAKKISSFEKYSSNIAKVRLFSRLFSSFLFSLLFSNATCFIYFNREIKLTDFWRFLKNHSEQKLLIFFF